MTADLDRILDAHGGLDYWKSLSSVDLEMCGLWLPTRRRVYPRGPFGRPLPLPTLVAIDIHDAQPRSA